MNEVDPGFGCVCVDNRWKFKFIQQEVVFEGMYPDQPVEVQVRCIQKNIHYFVFYFTNLYIFFFYNDDVMTYSYLLQSFRKSRIL